MERDSISDTKFLQCGMGQFNAFNISHRIIRSNIFYSELFKLETQHNHSISGPVDL